MDPRPSDPGSPAPPPPPSAAAGRGKQKVTAGIFALLLGGLGVHHFYLGSTPLGVLYLALYLGGCGTGFFVCGIPWAFSGVVGILALIEGILLLVMPDPEFDRRYNQRTRGPMEFVFTKPPAPPPAA